MFGKLENEFLTLSEEKRLGFKPIIESEPQPGTGKFDECEYIDIDDYLEKPYDAIVNGTHERL